MPFKFTPSIQKRRNPLTPEEAALARVIYDAIQRATSELKVTQLARIIESLDPDTLNRLLSSITLGKDAQRIEQSILQSIDIGGSEAISELRSIANRLVRPSFVPTKVDVTNPKEMRRLEGTKIPAWASSTTPKVTMNIAFDATNPNSLFYAQRRAAELIKSIDEYTRIAVRQIIIESFNDKVDYKTTANRIKNIVGLHPQWADAVIKFEKREMRRLQREGFTDAKARSLTEKRTSDYSNRLRSARATMIARTEIQIAQNEGRFESWKQAARQGFVDPAAQKMWIIANDERTCDICLELDGEVVGWLDTFSNGLERPIAHPNCRCTMKLLPPEKYQDIYFEETYGDEFLD